MDVAIPSAKGALAGEDNVCPSFVFDLRLPCGAGRCWFFTISSRSGALGVACVAQKLISTYTFSFVLSISVLGAYQFSLRKQKAFNQSDTLCAGSRPSLSARTWQV